MHIEHVALSTLQEHPANAREHPERSIRALAGMLKRFGQRRPVVVSQEGVILSGHGICLAAASLGWDEVDVLRVDDSPDDQLHWLIGDNRVAQLSRWKPSVLREHLSQIGRQAALFTADELNAIDRVQTLPRGEGDSKQTTKSWMHRRAAQTDTTVGLIGEIEMRLSNASAERFGAIVRRRAGETERPVRAVAQEMVEVWIASLS